MKMMTLWAALLLPLAGAAPAQDGDRTVLQYSRPGEPGFLSASLINGSIQVVGTDGKDIVVSARAREDRVEQEEEETTHDGLVRITKRAVGLVVEEKANKVSIETDSIQRAVDLVIEVPRLTSLDLQCINNGDIQVTGVEGELEVENINGDVTLKSISGSVIGHALNGRLLVVFDKVNPDKAMSFSTLNGTIDVTFPATLAANFKLENQNGEIYTGFDIDPVVKASRFEKNNRDKGGTYRIGVEKAMEAAVNGGGPDIEFKSMMGDIYIRKAK